MAKNNVVPIDKTKGLPKEFCLLCGKHVDSLEDMPTISFGQQTLMMKMCRSCKVVVHNFLMRVDLALKEIAKQQERRIILPDEAGKVVIR